MIPRIHAGPLFNLLTSGMQLRMFCRVLRTACLRFVVEFCAEIREAVGQERDADIENTTYAIIRSHNQEFMIGPETPLCFPGCAFRAHRCSILLKFEN